MQKLPLAMSNCHNTFLTKILLEHYVMLLAIPSFLSSIPLEFQKYF